MGKLGRPGGGLEKKNDKISCDISIEWFSRVLNTNSMAVFRYDDFFFALSTAKTAEIMQINVIEVPLC